MNKKLVAFVAVAFLLLPRATSADGCFIAPAAFANVQIPDQRALICFSNGVETLVIDTSLQGRGTNFAWIVPVPSVPKIEAATTGLFPTLQTIFQPEVIQDVFPYYWIALLVSVIVLSFVRQARDDGSLVTVALFWAGFLVFLAVMLPSARSTAGVSPVTVGQIRIFDRRTIGIYDTVTLASPDGNDLGHWLEQNGFGLPSDLRPAIRAYAREGWCFVASKIRSENNTSSTLEAYPLALKFKTDRPVYPLRLTGIGNEPCRIDLYIFGPGRASAANFNVERCSVPLYLPSHEDRDYYGYSKLIVIHPLLRKLVGLSPIATKLSARLTSRQMEEDAYISWAPFAEKRLHYYTSHGAALYASNIVITLVCFAFLAWYCFTDQRSRAAGFQFGTSALMAVSVVLCWLLTYYAVPRIQATFVTLPQGRLSTIHGHLAAALSDQAVADPRPKDVEWFRQRLQHDSNFRKGLPTQWQTNFLSGQPWREEDSPGNYGFRQSTNGIDYLWFDANGGEHSEPLFDR